MVLKIFYNNDVKLFTDIDSTFCVTKTYGGMMSLQFDISPEHSLYKYFALDGEVEYDNQRYLIKSIHERKTVSTIVCELNLDDLRADMFTIRSGTRESSALWHRVWWKHITSLRSSSPSQTGL